MAPICAAPCALVTPRFCTICTIQDCRTARDLVRFWSCAYLPCFGPLWCVRVAVHSSPSTRRPVASLQEESSQTNTPAAPKSHGRQCKEFKDNLQVGEKKTKTYFLAQAERRSSIGIPLPLKRVTVVKIKDAENPIFKKGRKKDFRASFSSVRVARVVSV